MQPRVALIGLGPHAKRIYLHFLAKYQCQPVLIVDLDSRRTVVAAYLAERRIDAAVYFINDVNRDRAELKAHDARSLGDLCQQFGVNRAIIATELKAHLAYAKFFLSAGISVLMDKPISAPINSSTDPAAARQVYQDYLDLRRVYDARPNKAVRLVVQCQRRNHAGYQHMRQMLTNVVSEYEVPVTHLDIFHSDGMWNMPSELHSRENHPYHYGYGKLMHSGYHFVDLLAWFENINFRLPNKTPNRVSLYHQVLRPNDFAFQVNAENYRQFFDHEDSYNTAVKGIGSPLLEQYGELDSYSQVLFKRDGKIVTAASLNLLQNSFSRRAWPTLPADTYKGNGRVRHERFSAQVGPLMNIQAHSYNSHEIRDVDVEVTSPLSPGGADHFDIYIFRNRRLVGGPAFERVRINEAVDQSDIAYLGQNERARDIEIRRFLFDESNGFNFDEHDRTNYLLSLLYQATV